MSGVLTATSIPSPPAVRLPHPERRVVGFSGLPFLRVLNTRKPP